MTNSSCGSGIATLRLAERALKRGVLLGGSGGANLGTLLRRHALVVTFDVVENVEPVVRLIEFADSIILTTDKEFRVYRRHSRQVVPCVTPE